MDWNYMEMFKYFFITMGGPSEAFFLIDEFQLSPLDTVHPCLNLHSKKSLKMVRNQEKRDLGQGKCCYE